MFTISEKLLDIPKERLCSNPDCNNPIGYRAPCDIRNNKSGNFFCSQKCHNISRRSLRNETNNQKQAAQTVKLPMTWIRDIERIVANNGETYPSKHSFCKKAIGRLLEYEIALL